MAAETRQINVWPWPSESVLSALKAAKAQMDVEWKIVPQRPVGGLGDRVLALGQEPPWIRDYLLVDPEDIGAVAAGIEWATDYWMDHPDAVTVPNVLQKAMKAEVKEIGE